MNLTGKARKTGKIHKENHSSYTQGFNYPYAFNTLFTLYKFELHTGTRTKTIAGTRTGTVTGTRIGTVTGIRCSAGI
jgi:hypothetical protein